MQTANNSYSVEKSFAVNKIVPARPPPQRILGATMRRPLPVILSAILLGIFAAFQLLAAAGMIFVAVVTRNKSLPAMPPGPTPLPASFLPVLFVVLALVYVAFAAWFIATLIGLVRLRSWARYSQLVIAGLMTAFAGVGLLMLAIMPSMMPTTGPVPNANIMHGVFLFIGLIYAISIAIGIAQLIYFNRARTRAIFLGDVSLPLAPPNTFTGKRRPTAITILSWLFMIAGPMTVLYAFFPLPVLVFGFVYYGVAAHVSYAAIGLLCFAIGYGLYRLRPESRIALFAWMVIGFLNLLALFTPWGARNFNAYMEHFAIQNAAGTFSAVHPIIIFSSVFATGCNLFILWLLYRHRDAFIPAPPPPPVFTPEPYDGLPS
jgi:hypothetical protein